MEKIVAEHRDGFTLLEVLIATAIGLLVISSLYGIFKVFDASRKETKKRLAINTDAISAMELLYNDISIAGYGGNLTGSSSLPICRGNFSNGLASALNFPCLGIQYASSNKITVVAVPKPDHIESITYDVYKSNSWETTVLGRTTNASTHQPVIALREPGIGFAEYLSLEYFNENGSLATSLESIRRVRATLTIFWTDGSPHEYTLDINTKNIGYGW